jgi:hypothetical protein
MNGATSNHNYGRGLTTGNSQFKGYIAEANFIDGQALGPESFGYQDPTTKQWLPRTYDDFGPEVNYGPNGHRLDFQSGSMGTDRSGNGRTFSLVSMSSTNDVVLDSPSNNFATLNPLAKSSNANLSEGSLKYAGASSTTSGVIGTIAVNSGKWYWEARMGGGAAAGLGVAKLPLASYGTNATGAYIYLLSGVKRLNLSDSSYGSSFTTGDIIGVALDMDAGTVTFYKNNVSQGTAFTGLSGDFTAWLQDGSTGTVTSWDINFGQDSSFAGNETRQSNQDGNSIGDFYYTPPTGYLALCTDNLPSPTIANGRDYFNTVLYTGNGTTDTPITGVGFQPDFVWLKDRTNAERHILFDAVRGPSNSLSSSTTAADDNRSDFWKTLDSDGFTLGYNDPTNRSGDAFVSWNWKANGTGVSNTDGDINSTVSASTTAGFSIVSYTGNGTSNQTVGHGLGQDLSMVILKSRSDASTGYNVWHKDLPNAYNSTTGYISLHNTNAAATTTLYYNGTLFSSSVFGLQGTNTGVNNNGSNYIAYCFSEVEGYSKFGTYTGNNNADGPFIYTGFRPAFVMIKTYTSNGANTSYTGWTMYDNRRPDPYNAIHSPLYANANYAEGKRGNGDAGGNVLYFDILSNGFKVRNTGTEINANTIESYIYMAFAENSFKYSNAR